MKWLPSKFALGNFALATLIIFIVAIPFYWIGPTALIAYIAGPITVYVALKLHRSRTRQYEILHPPTDAEFMYKIQTTLDQLQSDFDNFTLQVTIRQPEGG